MHDVNARTDEQSVRSGAVWVLAMVAAVPAAALVYATSFSLGVSPDGVIYGDAASRLARDGSLVAFQYGAVKPLTHFPPFFPALLSIAAAAGAPILGFARWLNVFLLWATVFGTGISVLFASRRIAPAVAAVLLVGTGSDLMGVHVALLSEPLFLPLMLLSLLAVAAFMEHSAPRSLLVAAVATAIACLVRFPAVALACAGVAALLLFRRGVPYARRFRDAALYAAIALGPLVAWLLTRSAGGATGRELAYHPPGRERLTQALDTAVSWLIPETGFSSRVDLAIVLMATAAVAWITVVVVRQGGPARSLALAHLAFAICYSTMLVVSASFVDAQTPFDRRILAPLRLSIVVLFSLGVAWLLAKSRTAGGVAVAIAVLVAAASGASTLRSAWRLHEAGNGYTARQWREAGLDRLVAAAGSDVYYSNAPEALYYLTGTQAREIPAPVDRWTRRPNPEYVRESEEMRRTLRTGRGVIVYFRNVRRAFVPDAGELAQAFALPMMEWSGTVVVLGRAGVLRVSPDDRDGPL